MINFKELFKECKVGVDAFDNDFKAIEGSKGIFIDEKLVCLYDTFPPKKQNQDLKNALIKSEFNYEILKRLFIYVQKKSEVKLNTKLFLSVPNDILNGKNRAEWEKNILKAVISSNWRKVFFIDSFLCAATGAGVPMCLPGENDDLVKYICLYSTKTHTYIGIIFAGSCFNVKVINKGYDICKQEDILEKIKVIEKEVKQDLPDIFDEKGISEEDRKKLIKGWNKKTNPILYAIVPKSMNNEINKVNDYNVKSVENYENCVINGLGKIIDKVKVK